MAIFKVPIVGEGTSDPGGRWNDQDLAATHPALVDWMGSAVDEEGVRRERGSLTLFTEGTWLKAALHDRQSGYRAFLTAASLAELLEAVERGLRTGDLDWRPPKADTPPLTPKRR